MCTDASLCVVGKQDLTDLATGARRRLQQAFRPKTQACYNMLFRTFVAFCVVLQLSLNDIKIDQVLAYLEYLTKNGVSFHMLANHVSAAKAQFAIRGLDHKVWSHDTVKYFLKSIRINRPMKIVKKNVMDVDTLNSLIALCDSIYMGKIFKAVFLLAFFRFLHHSNIAPHSIATFDPTRHLTAGYLIFTSHFMKIVLKWSKN